MLRGVFRTKEGKIIAAVLVFIAIIMGVMICVNLIDNRKYHEQAVMAEQYLEDENYELAVEAYLKALSMKDSDQELMSIGLAEAYIGVNEFDKALEVLRVSYQKTSGIRVKEKIEEVTSEKTDYEYLQSISRADIYFSNKEYDKAIAEYEKAKTIKSKEVTSYAKIAEAYLEKGEYELAREEVLEGIQITQSEELEATLKIVDSYQSKEQYKAIVEEASEYIYQENYNDGIAKYQKAINIVPNEDEAYIGLAETYITLRKYESAIYILRNALKIVKNKTLVELLDTAIEKKEAEDSRKQILEELYRSLEQLDIDRINEIIESKEYKETIAIDSPIYYSELGEGNISNGHGMIIYNQNTVYAGDLKTGMKKGTGVYFMVTEINKEQGYYYYIGEWSNDIPNGAGKTEEEYSEIDQEGRRTVKKIITEGTFYNAAENGSMHKTFFMNDIETGKVTYNAFDGVPQPKVTKNGKPIPIMKGKSYQIGVLYKDNKPTKEGYNVEPGTYWGVKPFLVQKSDS